MEANIPGSEGEEVGGHGLVHGELLDDMVLGILEGTGASRAGLTKDRVLTSKVGGGHDGEEGAQEVEFGREADVGDRGVLAGEDGAGMDGLALSEDKGMGVGGGLDGREPLKGRGRGGGEGAGGMGGEGEGKGLAEDEVGGGEGVG